MKMEIYSKTMEFDINPLYLHRQSKIKHTV